MIKNWQSQTLGIQTYSQMMIGMFNHLWNGKNIFRFHETILNFVEPGSPGINMDPEKTPLKTNMDTQNDGNSM